MVEHLASVQNYNALHNLYNSHYNHSVMYCTIEELCGREAYVPIQLRFFKLLRIH